MSGSVDDRPVRDLLLGRHDVALLAVGLAVAAYAAVQLAPVEGEHQV